jgi:diguanylate cyclase (GGDEF)-like protein
MADVPFSFQEILKYLAEGVLVVKAGDPPQIIYCNPASGAAVGDDLRQRYPGQAFEKALSSVLESGRSTTIQAEIEKDLSEWRSIRLSPLPEPGLVLVVERDISDQKKIERQLEGLIQVDLRTGLLKSDTFLSIMEREWRRARRYDHPLALIIFDIDKFKNVNERYGEAVGDLVLQVVARECQYSVRDVDYVGRLESDMFALLMPETMLDGALQAANRIRQAVEEMQISARDWVVRTTLSAGVTMHYGKDTSPDAMYLRAMNALETAKQSGRNRCASE